MTFDSLITKERQEVLGYVVFEGHTLGYLFRWFDQLGFGVLASKITKGGQSWLNSPKMITKHNFSGVREATQKDFDDFRVSSKGHI